MTTFITEIKLHPLSCSKQKPFIPGVAATGTDAWIKNQNKLDKPRGFRRFEPEAMNENQPLLWGFLRRRQCVIPTWRGWLLFLAVCAISATLAIRNAYDFLSMNKPLSGGILVVEGWGPDFFINGAAKEYQRNHYDALFVTGGPIEKGSNFTNYQTYADMDAATLEQLGIDPKSLHAITAPPVRQDRTYSSAIALKKWLSEHNMNVKTITVITLGAHARRSHLLYQKAFGDGASIGVISVKDETFDTHRWWASSQGVRSVTDEMVAYLYARFLFHVRREE
jgi:hypothetical protein